MIQGMGGGRRDIEENPQTSGLGNISKRNRLRSFIKYLLNPWSGRWTEMMNSKKKRWNERKVILKV